MAGASVSVRLGVEGGGSFASQMRAAANATKEASAKFKELNSSFEKGDSSSKKAQASVKALSSVLDSLKNKASILSTEYDKQKTKLDEIGQALEKAKEEYGENSTEVKNLSTQYNQQSAKVSKLGADLADCNRQINETTQQMEEAEGSSKRWQTALSGLGKVAKTVGVATAAIATAAAGIAMKIGKEVVGAYGEFEQLEGGVKKIFGAENLDAVVSNARNAFENVGISANDYMETVTGFSASLIQSMGGDTAAAVSVADRALVDMADNANTFGTDIQSVQNAYQGFAKQNYTMLDNLRLGYGGTKTEMQRLIKDASKLTDVQSELGITVDESSMSFENIINAIHVMQTEMGIAGATSDEAIGTIQGSTNMLKASIQDLWSALGGSGQDVGQALGNIVTSFRALVDNLKPVLMQIVAYIPEVVNALAPAITGMLPDLMTSAVAVFNGVLDALLAALPELIPVAVDGIMVIADNLVKNLPKIIEAAIQILTSIITGISQALPRLISYIPTIISGIASTLAANLPTILQSGISIIAELLAGVMSMAGDVFTGIGNFFMDNIWNPLSEKVKDAAQIGIDLIQGIWSGISSAASWLWNNISGWASNLLGNLNGKFGINSPSKETAWMGEMLARGMAKGISDNANLVNRAWSGITGTFGAMSINAGATGRYIAGSTFNIYQREGENGAALARRINRQLGAVYE